MTRPRWISMNLVGLALILAGYAISLVVVVANVAEHGPTKQGEHDADSVVIMHWQLEPGYREAMQAVIDEYNDLEHVRAAGIRVRQLAITERVYAQILNVHVISGTAPDICATGMSEIGQGADVAQYFEPLGSAAAEPNPYNDANRDLTVPSTNPVAAPDAQAWRETLIDGMSGGWIDALEDYYAVPTSFVGGVKLYYNRNLLAAAKLRLRDANEAQPQPGWYAALFQEPRSATNGKTVGYVIDSPALQVWLQTDDAPDTLGRLFMVGAATRTLAKETGNPNLVPIAGSSYGVGFFIRYYQVPFTSRYAAQLDLNEDGGVSAIETWQAWRAGHWAFEDPGVRAYYECLREVCGLFPAGFLGLDREQARRRFVAGDALFIASGLWDARSLYEAGEGGALADDETPPPGESVTVVDGVRRSGYRFGLGITDLPLPGPGERWSETTTHAASEADGSTGNTFMVYQRSPNKAWAIDFLRFLTSREVNERFNREAGWLPITLGARPSDQLTAFVPNLHGLPSGSRLETMRGARNLRTRFSGQLKSFLAGEMDYASFVQNVTQFSADEQNGVDRLIADDARGQRDAVRKAAQLLQAVEARSLLEGSVEAEAARRRVIRRLALMHNGSNTELFWRRDFPDEPMPRH